MAACKINLADRSTPWRCASCVIRSCVWTLRERIPDRERCADGRKERAALGWSDKI